MQPETGRLRGTRRYAVLLLAIGGVLSLAYFLFARNTTAVSGHESALGLTGPVDVEVDYYEDGGTTGVVIVDQNGSRFEFCIDCRLDTTMPGAVYVGAKHPTEPGASLLENGDPLLEAIVEVTGTWYESHLSRVQKLRARSGRTMDDFEIRYAQSALRHLTALRDSDATK